MSDKILFDHHGRLGLITINRPEALNAMDADMATRMKDRLLAWKDDPAVDAVLVTGAGGKAFCAGGDIRAVWKMRSEAMRFFNAEYDLVRTIRDYPKPYTALMDGITFGGGVGISVYARHRIATPRTVWAMPECAIGFYPDVGATWFLPRLPGKIGTYLGLTGTRLGAADLLWLGIATRYTSRPEDVLPDLAAGRPPAGETPAAEPTLRGLQPAIDRCFRSDEIGDIRAALGADNSEWGTATLATLDGMSPTSLTTALSQMSKTKSQNFEDALEAERQLTARFLNGHDFYEGVRAALIDRDRQPKWSPLAYKV